VPTPMTTPPRSQSEPPGCAPIPLLERARNHIPRTPGLQDADQSLARQHEPQARKRGIR
jgi:hypothetical protein